MSTRLSNIKRHFSNNIKNVYGWKTSRKIIVLSVDDYGNVKVDSKEALNRMEAQGVKPLSHFDIYDALETEQDLMGLYEVLSSVIDSKGNHAVFTAFALPVNIDYEKMTANNFDQYYYELLPETFAKLKGYENVWQLWKEGMNKKLIVPQFHGREHLNVKMLNDALQNKDRKTLIALENRSYTGISVKNYPSYTAAFDFVDIKENEAYKEIITDGLNCFEKVFGYRATNFNPPGGRESSILHKTLFENGIQFLDTPADKKEYQGDGKYRRTLNYMGKKNDLGHTFLIRNAVFEPTGTKKFDSVDRALEQIESAFRWKKPAIISSHRVNYCGHIDEHNRREGLAALKKLLHAIVKRWPDVEFMSANELGELIVSEEK